MLTLNAAALGNCLGDCASHKIQKDNRHSRRMTTRLIAFGGYDTRKPRVRCLIASIRRAGGLEDEIVIPGWESVAETNVPSRVAFLKVLAKLVLGYPQALWRLARSPRAAILLPYPGIIEIFLIAPLARLMRRRVVLDMFLPLYDTIVIDRGFVRRGSVVARAIWLFERAGMRLADVIVVDTDCHGDYFASEFGLDREKFHTILVGAENQFAVAAPVEDVSDLLGPIDEVPIVLFYGQLIPLHGVPTILDAARGYSGPKARWVVIGRGQLEGVMRDAVADQSCNRVEWIEWVEYKRLPSVIARADVCLGVFGASDKAARVIPNKLFQQLAMGKPVITRASPAVDALAANFPETVRTVPANDPKALADAVAAALSDIGKLVPLPQRSVAELGPDAGVVQLIARLDRCE